MDPKGVLRVQDTRRNELAAEEVAVEGGCPGLIVVAVEAVDQAVIHIDVEDHMTGKNYTEKVVVETAVEHLGKVMDAVE